MYLHLNKLLVVKAILGEYKSWGYEGENNWKQPAPAYAGAGCLSRFDWMQGRSSVPASAADVLFAGLPEDFIHPVRSENRYEGKNRREWAEQRSDQIPGRQNALARGC